MGWDGAGGYTRQHNFSADASAGIKILAARMDAELDDVASAITLAWARNGQNVPTQAVPMGGQRFINVGAATSVGNYMRVKEFIENVPIFMQDVESSADRISVSAQYFTSVSANQAPSDGTRIFVRAKSNKSSAALYLNGHSANVEYQDGNRIGPALVSGGVYEFLYSSSDTAWKIQNPDDGRTSAEIAAGVTPSSYQYEPGDVRRYGWDSANTGAQNATALAAAASAWGQGGPQIRLPAGTFSLSQFSVPSGRGLIISGEGPQKTFLDHNTSGSMFVLGADNIQQFNLRDLTIRPSASTTVLLDWSGDYQAYNFGLDNVELHQGSSGNTSCIAFQIVGGSNSSNHQKHYFKIFGLKIFGMGTGIKLDGTTAAANDLDVLGLQIQGCADDGILLNESSSNRIHASIENCGDGATSFNLSIQGTTSGDNRFWGRLENTTVPSQLVFDIDPSCDVNNFIHCTLTATPTPANDLCIPGGILYHLGREFSDIERRTKGFHRMLGSSSAEIKLVTALDTDTMGGRGRFGIEADGRHGWSHSATPSTWDAELFYSHSDTALRASQNFRAPMLEMTDGVTAPSAKTGFVQLFVDSADGDLKVIFGDGTTKTIVVDT
jgi:hypothetical protein